MNKFKLVILCLNNYRLTKKAILTGCLFCMINITRLYTSVAIHGAKCITSSIINQISMYNFFEYTKFFILTVKK